jgi:hypothetical protein
MVEAVQYGRVGTAIVRATASNSQNRGKDVMCIPTFFEITERPGNWLLIASY